jgi:hypothetical protein
VWEYNDLDSDESGRDESGVMHRIVLRESVRKCTLLYDNLTREEYLYMRSLLSGKAQFLVTYRDHDGSEAEFSAYHSNHAITIHNAKTGHYKNYKVSIIEC